MDIRDWPTRFYILDVSRGFAALAVVLWHWQHFAFQGDTPPHDFERESQPLYAVLRLFYEKGALGVEYFFLLSGFIFFWIYADSVNKRKVNAWEFFVHRFSRLYPLHFVTLGLVAVLQAYYFYLENSYFVYPFNDAYHFVMNVFFASKWGFESGWSFNAPVWSVSIEVLLYIVFFLFVFMRQGGWLTCGLLSILSFLFGVQYQHPIFQGLAMFFLGGVVFYIAAPLVRMSARKKAFIHAFTVLLWLLVVLDFYIHNLSAYIYSYGEIGRYLLMLFPLYVLFPLTILSFVCLETDKGEFLKSVSWIGDITYSSYLLHFPLQLLFGFAVSVGFLGREFYLDPLYLLAFFLVLIPLSYVVFVKFERPMQKVLRTRLLAR